MTAWGVVAVCAIGGGVSGPFVERVARRARLAARDGCAKAAGVPVGGASAGGAGAVGEGAVGAGGAVAAVGRAAATPERPAAPGAVGEAIAATAATAVLCALAAVRLGSVPSLAAFCALFGGLVAISLVDLHVGLVPRRLLYPTLGLVALGLAAASADLGAWRPLLDAGVGGAVTFVVFYAIWWIYPKGLGFGDVRLAGLCGMALGFLGFRQVYVGFLAAFLFGAVGGLLVLARRGSRRFPFAPALAAGTAFGVLWGGWLGNLWLHPG